MASVGCAGHAGVGTDHDKLLAQLETELKETQQIVRLQQQLLQVTGFLIYTLTQTDSSGRRKNPLACVCLQEGLESPLPSELADSHFLEEWERLQMQRIELDHQRRTFERERQLFTDAAIRLSREVSTRCINTCCIGPSWAVDVEVTGIWSIHLQCRLCPQRRDFEQQKALLVKQQYLCDSPLFAKGPVSSNRRESTGLSECAVILNDW